LDAFTRFIKLFTALSILALAVAILFFTLEIRQFRQQLPVLLEQVDETTQRVSPIINEVAELRKVLPKIIEQSEGYQQLIPEVLRRVDMIDPVLKQSDKWRAEIPALLNLVKETNKTIENTNQQIANTLPQIPLILAESEALRSEVPVILTKVESIVEQAERAGQDASKGMVTGLVGGILSTPFSLIGKIGENTTKRLGLKNEDSISKQDRKSYNQAMERLMKTPIKGANQSWNNEKTGNTGTITITEIIKKEQKNCYQLASQFSIAKGDDKGKHKLTTEACNKRK
jgi:hypothetical protein